jgi:phenol hydroxylase P5 protein
VDHGSSPEITLRARERADGKALACCAKPVSNLVLSAHVVDDPDSRCNLVRDFRGVVTSIKDLTSSIRSIFVVIDDPDFKFQAGQHVNVTIPGLAAEPRAFSIASPTSPGGVIELNVALVNGGEVTRYLHEQLQIGDSLEFTGPYGNFFVRESQPAPIVFIAGGSGLSGVKSMLMDLLERNDPRPVSLFYCASSERDVYYRELFEYYEREHSNFKFFLELERSVDRSGSVSEWTPLHDLFSTRFDGDFRDLTCYVCGQPQMVSYCARALMNGGCSERSLFMLPFYNNSDKVGKPARARSG